MGFQNNDGQNLHKIGKNKKTTAENREMLYTLTLTSPQECVAFLMRIRRSNVWEKKKIKNITKSFIRYRQSWIETTSTNWK